MAARRTRWVLGLTLGQVAALAVTLRVPGLGTATWHHVASLGLALAVTVAFRAPFRRSRRFLAIGILVTTILATVSGFWLLYWKAGLRVDGVQDWGVFWHVLWSWFAAVFFFQHTWINGGAFVEFLRRSVATTGRALVHASAYVLLVAAFLVTWSPAGRAFFTGTNYIPLSLRTWVLVALPPYLVWLYVRSRQEGGRAPRALGHWPVRRVVDLVLVPAAALTVLSGFPLLFIDPWLDANGFKYVSKFWHVWPSILFSVLVFVHGAQAWRAVMAHWRKLGRARRVTPSRTRPRALRTRDSPRRDP